MEILEECDLRSLFEMRITFNQTADFSLLFGRRDSFCTMNERKKELDADKTQVSI